jgi:hypothetical protein
MLVTSGGLALLVATKRVRLLPAAQMMGVVSSEAGKMVASQHPSKRSTGSLAPGVAESAALGTLPSTGLACMIAEEAQLRTHHQQAGSGLRRTGLCRACGIWHGKAGAGGASVAGHQAGCHVPNAVRECAHSAGMPCFFVIVYGKLSRG